MKVKTHDKNILLVTSEESKALNKNLVAFHKSFKLVFNATVLAHLNIRKGQFANFYADIKHRRVYVKFFDDKDSTTYRKVYDPRFSKVSEYLAINIKKLLWLHDLVCLGAFEYEWYPESKTMCIHI